MLKRGHVDSVVRNMRTGDYHQPRQLNHGILTNPPSPVFQSSPYKMCRQHQHLSSDHKTKRSPSFGIQQQLAMESSGIGRVAPLEAVLFDIDGTMAISDPFHHRATSEMLLKVGYNNGVPITPEFGVAHMAGRSNEQIGRFLFPDWDQRRLDAFFAEKEALFARYAAEGLREIAGLTPLCRWAAGRGLRRAAVTNAPRANAELMISILGLSDFFPLVVTAEECGRSKPFPDPYLRALDLLGVSPDHALVFEDSTTGVQAGVAAGMPVVAIADESREDKLLAVGATLVIRDYEDPKLWTALDTTRPQAADAAEANGKLTHNCS